MHIVSKILIGLVIAEHLYILWLEMFVWTTKGRQVFKTIPSDLFEQTKVMAANQGLYNGFLALGLGWSLLIKDAAWAFNIACFFLSCVVVAGIYGALTVHRAIFIKQAVPAIAALLAMLILRFL